MDQPPVTSAASASNSVPASALPISELLNYACWSGPGERRDAMATKGGYLGAGNRCIFGLMARKPKVGPKAPNLTGAASGDEFRLFHDIVRKHGPLPAGVQRVEFRFGEDSTGAPAVWIVFVAKDDLNPSSESINAIRRVAEEVRSEVRRTSSERWPYVEIEAE